MCHLGLCFLYVILLTPFIFANDGYNYGGQMKNSEQWNYNRLYPSPPYFNYFTAPSTSPQPSNHLSTCKTLDGRDGSCVPYHECMQRTNPFVFLMPCNNLGQFNFVSMPLYCCPVHRNEPQVVTTARPIASSRTEPLLPEPALNQENYCGRVDSEEKLWPWIVKIGREAEDTTNPEWLCIGTLLTQEYILTTAGCIKKKPSFVSVRPKGENNEISVQVVESFSHENFADVLSHGNVGLIRIENNITKSTPLCFPFLGGVLDIIKFTGKTGSTMVLTGGLKGDIMFTQADAVILKPEDCKMPLHDEIQSDHMCWPKSNGWSFLIEGTPLVYFDNASDSNVLIGWALPEEGQMSNRAIFVRANAYSSWIRQNIPKLPSAPPCFV